MEHAKGHGREDSHSDYGSPSGPEEGRTCQREEEEQGRGRGVWHGQEVLGRLKH